MELVERAEDIPEPISIARCRELRGEESITDHRRVANLFVRRAHTVSRPTTS